MTYQPSNLLGDSNSPYLRQHKGNPVHWQPWGPAAFAAAATLDRPVLLSVGYAACHWCHVMAHESFENPAIARVMNERFINIKLDREERPDLDALYQQSLALMGQQGGWPLTMFLGADGIPFWGGTYFPPLPRHGLPGFADVLVGVAHSYAHEKDAVVFNAKSLRTALMERFTAQDAPPVTPEIVARTAKHFLGGIDARNGGLGSAPKFPQLPRLRLLWDHHLRSGDENYGDAVMQALVQMCRGGLYDHVGGGFHRYCVDAEWKIPHFEKMLDDQALFIHLLADVLSWRPHALLARALEDTVAFILRDMRDEKTGLFISSLDADSGHGEGAAYVWQAAEIDALLGGKAALFRAVYAVDDEGNTGEEAFHTGNILHRLGSTAVLPAEEEETLRHCRKKLLYARRDRPQPPRDDKIMTDANARVIAALGVAGWRCEKPESRQAAETAFQALGKYALDRSSLPRHVAGDPLSLPLLDDAAAFALAALTLAEVRSRHGLDPADLHETARQTITAADQAFSRSDGAVLASLPADGSFIIPLPLYDSSAPAGSGAFLRALLQVWHITGDAAWQARANSLAATLAAPARDDFAMMAATLAALQFYQNPIIIHASGTQWEDLARRYLPDALWLPADKAEFLTVCLGSHCLAPCANEDAATQALQQVLRRGLHRAANL